MEQVNIESLEHRLSKIEASLSNIDHYLAQAPSMVSIATDTIDDVVDDSRKKGVDLEERIKTSMELIQQITQPEVHKSLTDLLNFVSRAPGLISMMTDTLDEAVSISEQGAVTLDQRVKGGLQVISQLTEPHRVKQIQSLLDVIDQIPGLISIGADSVDEIMKDNDILSGENIDFIKKIAQALTEANHEPAPKVGGILSMLRTMRDPDRQRSVGFIMNVMKKLGQKL